MSSINCAKMVSSGHQTARRTEVSLTYENLVLGEVLEGKIA